MKLKDYTLAEWWKIWMDSGKFSERGASKGKYVMARHNDTGDYEMGNVKIILFEENLAEGKGVFYNKVGV